MDNELDVTISISGHPSIHVQVEDGADYVIMDDRVIDEGEMLHLLETLTRALRIARINANQ